MESVWSRSSTTKRYPESWERNGYAVWIGSRKIGREFGVTLYLFPRGRAPNHDSRVDRFTPSSQDRRPAAAKTLFAEHRPFSALYPGAPRRLEVSLALPATALPRARCLQRCQPTHPVPYSIEASPEAPNHRPLPSTSSRSPVVTADHRGEDQPSHHGPRAAAQAPQRSTRPIISRSLQLH